MSLKEIYAEIVVSFVDENIVVMPEDIWNNIIWRNRRMDSFLDSSTFEFNIFRENLQDLTFSILTNDYLKYWKKSNRHHFSCSFLKFWSKIKFKIDNFIINKIYDQKIVFGRVACVGQDIFRIKTKDLKNVQLVNMQKARLDLLINWTQGHPKPKSHLLENHMARSDIFPMIVQQENMKWFSVSKEMDYLVIDSFSELTDQKFTHRKEGWAFCCHYTDLKHSEEFDATFECNGLLELDKLEDVYATFFNWFEKEYPGKKIIYIHYSARFDHRDEFRKRANKILSVIEKAAIQRSSIINLYLPEELYFQNDNDNFPYHYSKVTYKALAEKWNSMV